DDSRSADHLGEPECGGRAGVSGKVRAACPPMENPMGLTTRLMILTLSLFPAPPFLRAEGPVPSKRQPPPPEQPDKDRVGIHYGGTVTDVTKDSVTIRWPGETPKRFQVSETLAKGEFPTLERPGLISPPGALPRTVIPQFRYRLSDVKVGDLVA